jgi:peptide chain release factor 1
MSEILSLIAPTRTRFLEICADLEKEDFPKNPNYRETLKEHGRLLPMMRLYDNLEKLVAEKADLDQIIKDDSHSELGQMAKEELPELEKKIKAAEGLILAALMDTDEDSSKNAIVEIRAGVGGDEAGIFAGDLFRMYSNYALKNKWKIDILNGNTSEKGGFKELVFLVKGNGAYKILSSESGGHRVQRVPDTENMGRVHTSAVTVAVLPEVEAIDVQINPADLKIDTYRASGAGGQHVNTTDSAVRITHIPTGIIVASQDQRSQIQNRERCDKILRAKIYEYEKEKRDRERGDLRRDMIGSGDRSERIRTYNFPQNRVTDHRANITLYNLDLIIEGDLGNLFDGLQVYFQAELLNNLKRSVAERYTKK